MPKNKDTIGSDLAKIDAHVIQPHEYEEIPELGKEWFDAAKLHTGGKPVRRGRPKSAHTKKMLSLRLPEDMVEHLKRHVSQYNVRIEQLLREAMLEGRL